MMLQRLLRLAVVCLGGAATAACSLFDSGAASKPAGTATPLPPAGRAAFYVRVERGQSLDQLARLYRVPKQRIIAANDLIPPYRAVPGSQLEIPLDARKRVARAAAPKSGKPHKLVAGKARKKGNATAHARAKRRNPEVIVALDPD